MPRALSDASCLARSSSKGGTSAACSSGSGPFPASCYTHPTCWLWSSPPPLSSWWGLAPRLTSLSLALTPEHSWSPCGMCAEQSSQGLPGGVDVGRWTFCSQWFIVPGIKLPRASRLGPELAGTCRVDLTHCTHYSFTLPQTRCPARAPWCWPTVAAWTPPASLCG